MNKKNLFAVKHTLTCLLLLLGIITVKAQTKYPKIQAISLRAPDNIKIDGNAKEWNNSFQAWTTVNKFFYTLSNDDSKLYLTVGTEGPIAIAKIMQGGITLTVSRSIEKRKRETDTTNVSVTYPLVSRAQVAPFIQGDNLYFVELIKDTVANRKQIDSVYTAMNKQLVEQSKEIKVKGIKAINDTLVSIYNTEGIRAVATFDKHIRYTYELAIPLKYLGLDANDATKFSYNIKLSGPPPIRMVSTRRNVQTAVVDVTAPSPNIMPPLRIDPRVEYLRYPSDFWAEYTLAKK